ncbi:MAG: hypothetical protein HYS86_04500 [Candidatus Chisholmbacteria bacterium]|nr:hypothetical protein [Candidatus Chisholmbacteria bacterium]
MKQFFQKHWLPLLSLIIFGLIGSKALLHQGFYTSHDGEHQLVRQYIFDRAVNNGHFPPRVDRQLMNGLGYPLFTFTYQFPFWIGEVLVKFGFSIPDSIKGVFVLTYLASGITMYLFAEERFGKLASFVAGFLYVWAPYRFLTMLVRAQLGEHVALMFIPLIFWSLNKINHTRAIIGCLSIAGLILSHSMVTQMAALPIGLFFVFRLLEEKKKLVLLKHALITAFLGVALSVFYLIPATVYRGNIVGLNRTFYAEHFVTLRQLIYSPWGYTFSVFGTENDGMSFQIGIAQWLAVTLAIIIILIAVILRRKPKNLLLIPISLFCSFTIAIFLMTAASSRVWEKGVSSFLIVDIPWRFLTVTTFSAAVLAAFTLKHLNSKLLKISLTLFLMGIAIYTNRNHLRVNKYIDIDPQFFTHYKGTSNSYDEYQPVGTSEALRKIENLPPVQITEGEGELTLVENLPQKLSVKIENQADVIVRLNTGYFPGWQLLVDNLPQDIKRVLSDNVPQIKLSSGNHTLNLWYEPTLVMKFANILSLVAVAAITRHPIKYLIKRYSSRRLL